MAKEKGPGDLIDGLFSSLKRKKEVVNTTSATTDKDSLFHTGKLAGFEKEMQKKQAEEERAKAEEEWKKQVDEEANWERIQELKKETVVIMDQEDDQERKYEGEVIDVEPEETTKSDISVVKDDLGADLEIWLNPDKSKAINIKDIAGSINPGAGDIRIEIGNSLDVIKDDEGVRKVTVPKYLTKAKYGADSLAATLILRELIRASEDQGVVADELNGRDQLGQLVDEMRGERAHGTIDYNESLKRYEKVETRQSKLRTEAEEDLDKLTHAAVDSYKKKNDLDFEMWMKAKFLTPACCFARY